MTRLELQKRHSLPKDEVMLTRNDNDNYTDWTVQSCVQSTDSSEKR